MEAQKVKLCSRDHNVVILNHSHYLLFEKKTYFSIVITEALNLNASLCTFILYADLPAF